MEPTKNNYQLLNALDLATPISEASRVKQNDSTKQKVFTIAQEFEYLDLANKSNATAIPAKLNFAGTEFKDNIKIASSNLQELKDANILTSASKQVISYNRGEVQKLFNFKTNGFEFHSCKGDLFDNLVKLAENPQERKNRVNFRNSLQRTLTEWAKNQGIECDVVIPVDTVYRNTDPQVQNAFGAVMFTHVDFSKDTVATMRSFLDTWKNAVGEATNNPNIGDEEFANTKVVQMVNVWLPLKDKPTENTLALMDKDRIQYKDLRPYTAVRRDSSEFTAMIISPSNKHQYIIQSDMQRGDMVIFDTMNTPHSAAILPRPECEKNLHRESIEVRVLFVQKDNKAVEKKTQHHSSTLGWKEIIIEE